IGTHLRVLSNALRQAEKLGRVSRNVVRLVDPPRMIRKERQTLSLNVARKLRRSFEFIKKQWLTETIQLRNRYPLRQSTMHLPAAYPRIDLASLLQMEPQRFGIPGRLSLAYHR